jgi:methionine biosynthesis protein MetW
VIQGDADRDLDAFPAGASTTWRGRMPVSELLSNSWYETPNIHLCTIRDFVALCDAIGTNIERSVTLDRHGRPFALDPRGGLANMLAEQGVFVLSGTSGGAQAG